MTANSEKARRPVVSPVAVVTGAGPGLGGALALDLARAGARLVICDIDPARLDGTEAQIRAMGGEVLCLPCDVSNSAAVEALVAQAASQVLSHPIRVFLLLFWI